MMNIALLAPFEESVPPKTYGGIEQVVWNIARELVMLGHNVTLFASKDSKTTATLIPCVPRAIRVLPESKIPAVRLGLNYQGLIKAVYKIRQGNFDIIHNHFGWQLLLFKDLIKQPIVTTLHGLLSAPGDKYMHNLFKKDNYISISNSQRQHAKELNYIATVHNGIDTAGFEYNDKPEDYLVFLGRIHPHKGPKHAISIAKKTKQKLIIAAKIDPLEQKYFEHEIKPLIDNKQIEFIGEVNHKEKVALLKNAKAMISPIQWDEPFGITNIEALACGTPVIGIARGSLPEILVNGVTGYLCKNAGEIAKRVFDIHKISRKDCRDYVVNNFSARQMTLNYVKAYKEVIAKSNIVYKSAYGVR